MLESKVCKYCGCVFHKRDFPKVFNRMVTCGSNECKKKLKNEWTFTKLCPDCNKPIVYSAKKCHSCSSKGEGNSFYGKTHKPESLININLFKVGHIPYLKGKHHKEESNLKNRISHWKGGAKVNPYTMDWNKILKRSIRERDNYTCQLCGELQDDYAFDVHHIDYTKKNCNHENLITLCRSCHSKTNYNRNKWKELFNEKIKSFGYYRTAV